MKNNFAKKMMSLSVAFLVIVFGVGYVMTQSVTQTVVKPIDLTVAIDAGHGGIDGGCVGMSTGVTESELNLQFAQKLTKMLTNFGIKVVNTRTDKNGLYDEFSKNYKLEDMKKRIDIINGANAQILISIHMNKYSNSSQNGAQVFFKQGDENSQKLAESIKDMLTANFDNARKLVLSGDYYILNNSNTIGVICECGFLSNPEEEKNLQNDEYQTKMCYSIYCGIINFLGVANNY